MVSHGEKSHRVKTGGNGEGAVVRERVVREGLCCVRQELKERERKRVLGREKASAKALRSEHAEHLRRTARRLVCLEQREHRDRSRDEVGKVTGSQVPGAGVSKLS